MADEPDPVAAQKFVDKGIEEVDGAPLPVETKPGESVYKLDPASKIPVSKQEGTIWKGRKDAGEVLLRDLKEGWREAEYYYNNAQQNHRKETEGNKAGNRAYGKDRRESYSMTENIVYATVNSVIPNTYAKNPNVEVTMLRTPLNADKDQVATMLKQLLNRLAGMREAPGLHLKPKAKKCIVRCEITNESWMMYGWVKRENSSEQAMQDIQRIGKELSETTDKNKILELEGQLLALEESVDLLDPPGPFIRTLHSTQVIVDSDACEDDYSDANWMMVSTMMSTSYLNARYRVKLADGKYGSAYKPSHIVDAAGNKQDTETVQSQIDNFKMFDVNVDDPKNYGYDSKLAYERAKRTKCWYVFDKVKRRFYLYSDADWTWPIWVFDDPYHLPWFYPISRMMYHANPTATRSRGEVSHYLDQQDEINTIVDELNRARVSLRDNTIFDSNVLTVKDVEDIMLNANKKMKGVKVPAGMKLADLIMGPPMPTLEREHLWDKSSAKQAITMISGLGEAMRGEQYKTNTTNQAIEQYNSISGMRLDEKRDAIEDFIGEVMRGIMYLWLQFADPEATASIVDPELEQIARGMSNMTADDIRKTVLCNIEGGSTQKPTSAAKKAEALQIGQIMGQFASASPVILLFVLKVFSRAFDMTTVTKQDWDMLMQSITMAIQQQSQPEGAQQGGAQEGGDDERVQAAIKELVQRGMPEEQARQEVMKRVQH